MALAFPGQGGTLWEVMARDAFLDALGDQSLRVRVLEKDPMTLDEALKLACRSEAIATGGRLRRPWPAERQVRALVSGGQVTSSAGPGPAHRKTGDGAGRVPSRTEPLS